MKKVAKIIEKDIKLLLRSKTSSLIVIFAPLLIMFIVGTAFDNSNEYSIKIGVYSEAYSDVTESFLQKLVEEKYVVTKLSMDDCIQQIKLGTIHTCVVFPRDMKISDETSNEIVFHVDYSKINLVWMILESLSSKLQARSREISVDLTKTLLDKLKKTNLEISSNIKLVGDIRAKQQESLETVDAIYSDINSLRIDINDYKLGNLEDAANLTIDGIHDFKTDTFARITEVKKKLDTISQRLKIIAGNETEDSTYRGMIKSISYSTGNLENVEFNLNKALNITDENFYKTKSAVSHIKRTLNGLHFTLVNIKTKTSDNSVKLKEAITKSLEDLDSVDRSFESILTNLGGVMVTEAEKIASPVTTRIEPVTTEKTNLSYVFSGLLVLVIMFMSLLLATTIVMMEKNSPSYFRNFITPTANFVFVAGSYLSSMVLIFVQVVIILLISGLFFNAFLVTSILNAIFLIFLITSMFILLGMLIGYTYTSQETAIIASISLGSLLLLLSNTILPLESMPKVLQKLAQFNPFVIAESVLKKTMLFNQSLLSIYPQILVIFGYCLILIIFIWIVQSLMRRDIYSLFAPRHKPAKTESTLKKVVKEATDSIRQGNFDKAFYYYREALDIYNDLRSKKHKHAKELYTYLNKLRSSLQKKWK